MYNNYDPLQLGLYLDTQYKILLLDRTNQLEHENRELKNEVHKKKKQIKNLEINNEFLNKMMSDINKKKQNTEDNDIINVLENEKMEIVPNSYVFLSKEIINDDLLKMYKEINSIDDVILLEINEHRFSYMRNEKFARIYKIIPCLKQLKCLIGMENVKKEIFEHIGYFVHNLQNKSELMHIVITGPPGVGKTELGSIISKMYLKMGFLTSNKFIVAKRSDLIGKYLGETAIKTQEVINKALGGVLFIDEVYSLGNSELRDSFSKECIDTINQNLTDNKGKFLCIIAGYKEDIETCFFAYNKGLKRRFPITYNIDGYNAEQLFQILLKKTKDDGWMITDAIKVKDIIEKNIKIFKYFGGDIEIMLQKAKFIASSRFLKTTTDTQIEKILTFQDFKNSFEDIFKNRKVENDVPYGLYI